jgi:hypothetical protein
MRCACDRRADLSSGGLRSWLACEEGSCELGGGVVRERARVWWLVAQFVIADVCCGNKFLERCSMDGYRDGSRCFACEMWRAFFLQADVSVRELWGVSWVWDMRLEIALDPGVAAQYTYRVP